MSVSSARQLGFSSGVGKKNSLVGSQIPPGAPAAVISATTGSPTIDTTSRPGKTIYKFTGSGSLTVSSAGIAEIFLVGGGGSGFAGPSGPYGGGGGGGFVEPFIAYLEAGTNTVTVGAGGSNTNGSPSFIFNTTSTKAINTAVGGGRAHSGDGWPPALNGGSGGGRGGDGISTQGNPGTSYGGGGAAAASTGPPGGAGRSTTIDGSTVFYSGGGGAVANPSASGGIGGGGTGRNGYNAAGGSAGTANTGGGGGGNWTGGFNGGSGIVIVVVG